MTETVEDAVIIETGELVPRDAPAPTLFNTDDPTEIITKAVKVADVLKGVIVAQKMALRIGSSEYIKVEGWTALGNLLGVYPKTEYSKPGTFAHIDPKTGDAVVVSGWEAAVVVVNVQGVEIGRAEAQCTRGENNWKNRDDFALRSMAQTRAMGKALRMPLGWIAVMAGYEATPAEEMPSQAVDDKDIPFDDTGGAQGRADEDRKAHGTPGTDAASTTYDEDIATKREELRQRLDELAVKLDKRMEVDSAAGKDWTKNEKTPHLHNVWLEKQIEAAQAKVDEQEEQLPI